MEIGHIDKAFKLKNQITEIQKDILYLNGKIALFEVNRKKEYDEDKLISIMPIIDIGLCNSVRCFSDKSSYKVIKVILFELIKFEEKLTKELSELL